MSLSQMIKTMALVSTERKLIRQLYTLSLEILYKDHI